MSFVVFGLSHRSAPLDLRERVAIGPALLPTALARLATRRELGEVMVLSTCNRVEVFASARDDAKTALAAIESELSGLARVPEDELRRHAHSHVGGDAVRHIFRVAASLESMVVGEPQILGQLKEACEMAAAAGTLGGPLARVFHRATYVARRVRTETAIGEGTVSISSVAVDLARQIFGDLGGHTVLLVGAGEMAESAARSLGKGGRPVRICNRSLERASKLAADFGGIAATWSALEEELALADVAVVSTGAESFVVTRELARRVARARRGRTLFLIDIAVPRNVDPAIHGHDNIYVFNIDDLEDQVEAARACRGGEVTLAERIVDGEVAEYERWVRAQGVAPTLVALRAKTRATLNGELDRSFSRLKHLGEGDRAALKQMVESAVNKLLHAPTTRLKARAGGAGAEEAAALLEHLFDLEPASRRVAGRDGDEPSHDDTADDESPPDGGYSH